MCIDRFTCSGTVSVWLLQGGFASFEAAYPFMCTRHGMYDPCLCYPQEIVPKLFLGSQTSADEIKVRYRIFLCVFVCVWSDFYKVDRNGHSYQPC